jgi:hypothetical protein
MDIWAVSMFAVMGNAVDTSVQHQCAGFPDVFRSLGYIPRGVFTGFYDSPVKKLLVCFLKWLHSSLRSPILFLDHFDAEGSKLTRTCQHGADLMTLGKLTEL